MPGPIADRVNLPYLFDTFRSTNTTNIDNIRWVFNGDKHALDGENIDGHYIGLFSFPRCGSTFTRQYLENITGISTGASLTLLELGGQELQLAGFLGEE